MHILFSKRLWVEIRTSTQKKKTYVAVLGREAIFLF